ncbi:superinfection exclusion B family protein [Nostoc sp. XA010]|uniref:superinfection exclusion B family protein n=1 Tax=Nostoc sp. XA010 TaxID=2780407 RepID=UPI001E55DC16|nr:superinfection exclusion B family protein [Nostoc sp. XA010]MCC5660612.1 superinfection exclusion B family protein [Nostoc sp. XA010]
MTKKHSNFSGQEQFHPVLVILVAGSLSLAIVDQSNRPAYFDIVKIAVVYFFGTTKSQENINKSNNLDDSEIADNSDSPKCNDSHDKPK